MTHVRPSIALGLAVAIAFAPGLARAQAASASFNGRVFETDGLTPRSDAVVAIYDEATGLTVRSDSTSPDGTFLIEDAPAGTYALLIETADGAFVAPEPVVLEVGANRPLALALQSGANYEASGGLGSTQSQGLAPVWKWVIVGVIAAAALYVIVESSSSDDPPASPF